MGAFFEYLRSLPTPFSFAAVVVIFAIFCGVIHTCYTAYLNTSLKREMLSKGMSAEDIERVMNAGKCCTESKDNSSGQSVVADATVHCD